jgi:hypothetical protein
MASASSLTFVDRGLNDDALPGDAFLSCGNVPISLGKMLAFSIGVHVFRRPASPPQKLPA